MISLDKASGKAICRHPECKNNPEYISPTGKVKKGTTCAWITINGAGGWMSACYCRECIEKIHEEMKMVLNPKLWIFQ